MSIQPSLSTNREDLNKRLSFLPQLNYPFKSAGENTPKLGTPAHQYRQAGCMRYFKISSKTGLYRFGTPFPTGAVLKDPGEGDAPPAPTWDWKGLAVRPGPSTAITLDVARDQVIWGLGEQVGAMNRHGLIFETYCLDTSQHIHGQRSLYGAHPFLILPWDDGYRGLFLDFPGRVKWDLGFSRPDAVEIGFESGDFDLYLFRAKTPVRVIREYLRLTGDPYLPPRRGFGYQQSRWAYPDEKTVREVVANFEKSDIPLDGVNLDIDYMNDFQVFTINKDRFPDLGALVKELKEKGVYLTPIVDPGVQICPGYRIYEEGSKNGYFVRTRDGKKDWVGAVWPGEVHMPDFQKPEVRRWWGQNYQTFTRLGIESFWNDMNEPAIFFSRESLGQVFAVVHELEKKKKLGFADFFHLSNQRPANNPLDFKAMHQDDGKGGLICHDRIHNLYGFQMTRASAEELEVLLDGRRPLLYSRASYAGMHRYSGVWTGDNSSWWEHILLHMKMVAGLHMCGFLYSGSDAGGFMGDSTADLVIRWSQLGVFTPLFRNHASAGSRAQEPYSFDEDTTRVLRHVIRLRYALLPWLYSEFMKAALSRKPWWRPLGFHFKDSLSIQTEDQMLLGSRVMIAPVYQPNTTGRTVYLPKDDWLTLKFKRWDYYQAEIRKPGVHWVSCELEETLVFLRRDTLIALVEPGRHSGATRCEELRLVGFVRDKAVLRFYEDDGETGACRRGDYSLLEIRVRRIGGKFVCRTVRKGQRPTTVKRLWLDLYAGAGVNGRFLYELSP